MSKSISKTLLDTIEQRTGTVITEQEMKALKKRWGPLFVKDHDIDVWSELEKFQEAAPFLVSAEQTEKGLAWWKAKVFKPNGKVRNSAFVNDNLCKHHLDILRSFDRFEFVDWEFIGNYDYVHPFPVYRVVAKNGGSFKYVARGWQSGDSFVI